MRFSLRKFYRTVSLTLLFVVSWATFAHAATQDVRVTNFPTSYSVVNTTWDSRLSTLQTTLQSLAADMSQFPTFVSRFGWNGTMSFSQGFELLYNDVHSLATATSSSDILTAFNREFPSSSVLSLSSKNYLYRIHNRLDGTAQSGPLWDSKVSLSSIDTYTQHIDSDMHSVYDKVDSFRRSFNDYSSSALIYQSNISTKVNQIKADTGNISVDTEHISGTQDVLVSQGAITMYNVGILREFFADDDTLARKEASEAASGEALDSFTGNGASSASVSDYADISDASTKLNQSFNTGQVSYSDAFTSINSLPSGNNSPWAWFSQATYDSINPQSSRGGSLSADSYLAFYDEQLASENRKGISDTPLLDDYNRDIEKAIGI